MKDLSYKAKIRLYVKCNLQLHKEIKIESKQFHYLTNVMRRKRDDILSIFNEIDGEFVSQIINVSKKDLTIKLLQKTKEPEKKVDIWVIFALVKKNPTDLIVQKATELGASCLIPVVTERTITRNINLKRMEEIVIEASEQCERITIPEIKPIQKLDDMINSWDQSRKIFYGDETVRNQKDKEVAKELLNKISENFGFTPPQEDGYSVVHAIKAMHEEKVKVFLGMGGNFLSAAPDTNYTAEALSKCNLTAHISTKLNRSHLTHGKTALILPSMGRTDRYMKNGKSQFVSVENSMGVVHTTQGLLQPPSEFVESEPVIVANIAKATLDQDKVDWDFLIEDYANIRDLIEKTIAGFENYNERLKKPLGFELPNGARTGNFTTPNKKANFTVNKVSENNCEEGEYLMMTTRSHDQFNTTIYGLDDRYRGVFNGRMVVFMNEDDVKSMGLQKEDLITLYNNYDNIERVVEDFAVVPYDIPKGCLATYFPEANPLVPLGLQAHSSHTPSSKSVKVKIRKSKAIS